MFYCHISYSLQLLRQLTHPFLEDESRVIHLSATWLRDNSPDSMDNVSHGRKFLMSDLKQAVKIVKVKFVPNKYHRKVRIVVSHEM